MLASGASAAQRARISGQPERSLDEFLSDGRVAPKGECDQTPRGRHRLHGEISSGDGRPRLYARAVHFCHESAGLKCAFRGAGVPPAVFLFSTRCKIAGETPAPLKISITAT